MWKESYKRANHQIPLNEELRENLMKKAESNHAAKKHFVYKMGTAAAVILIGIGIFSRSFLKDDKTYPIADVAEPKTKLIQETETKANEQPQPETVQTPVQQPVTTAVAQDSVSAPKPSVEKTEEKDEAVVDFPATASAVMPRTVPSGEQSEEPPSPEVDETDEQNVSSFPAIASSIEAELPAAEGSEPKSGGSSGGASCGLTEENNETEIVNEEEQPSVSESPSPTPGGDSEE